MSTALVRLQRKGQMVIPRSLREEAGVAEGTLMKVAVVEGGRFLLTPQITINRSVVTGPSKDASSSSGNWLRPWPRSGRSQRKGLDKMPMREIRAAVTAVRRDLRKTSERSVK